MNFINKGFLKFALLPKGLYRKLGVDTAHLKSIVTVKLTIDDRRPNTIHQTQWKKSEKPITGATIGTIIMSVLLGLIYLVAFAFGNDTVTQLTLYFSVFFFMLSASLISDFTSVLIDVRDTYIILPKPVSDRTIVVARLVHIFVHICKIIVPMSLPAAIFIGYKYSFWGSICLLAMVLLLTVFVIFFINALYILILRFTSPQKFQSIISSVQIIFAITLYATYQIVPRMVGSFSSVRLDVHTSPFIILAPSFWFASGWNVLYSFSGSGLEIGAAVLSIIIPVVSLIMVVTYLAPLFNNKLAMISSTSGEAEKKSGALKTNKTGPSYAGFLSRLFCKRGPERMGFLFTWKMTARSRDFKLKVYPSIGYILVYVVIIFFNRNLQVSDVQQQTATGKTIIISALYFGSFLLVIALNQMFLSQKYKASWIYYTTPVFKPGEIIIGSVKATISKFYIPLVAVITVAGLILTGTSAFPNIILGCLNELLIASLIVYIGHKQLPFSSPENNTKKAGSFVRSLSIFIVSGFIALVHYFIYDFTAAVLLLSVLSLIATWFIMDSIKNISWQKVSGNKDF